MIETRVIYAHPETASVAFDVDVFGTFGADPSIPVEDVDGFDPAWTPVAVVEFKGALARLDGDVKVGASGRIWTPLEIVTSTGEDGEPLDLPKTIRVLWSALTPYIGPGESMDTMLVALEHARDAVLRALEDSPALKIAAETAEAPASAQTA